MVKAPSAWIRILYNFFLEFVWEMCGSREKNLSGVPSYYAALPPCTGPVFRIRPKSNRQYAPIAFIPAHAIP